MFGIAIWDTRHQRLFLARDRLGIKPLYYWTMPGGGLAFASELRAILALAAFPATIDPQAVGAYLAFGYVPDPHAIFRDVHKLAPGHSLMWTPSSGAEVVRYWTPVRDEEPVHDVDEAEDALRSILSEAVRYHLESDVPLGAFLSGGVDSSSVVAFMAELLDRRVRTFSIGFDEPEFNEAEFASSVAKALGTEHTELIVRPNADVLLEQVVAAFDEPFADPSSLPTFLVSLLARQHVTVALSGDGGDELFGGYTRYGDTLKRTRYESTVARSLLRRLALALPFMIPGRNRLLDASRTVRGQYVAAVAAPLQTELGGVGARPLAEALGPFEELLDAWFDVASLRDVASQLPLVDLFTYLPGDILTKVDRMSMAASLEARVPLLDHVVAEFALSLPSELKLRNGTGKWLFRRAIQGKVPPLVLERRKQGFGVPLRGWFRKELRHRLERLQRPSERLLAYVDAGAVARVTSEHLMRRRDHAFILWRLLVLDLWLEFLDEGKLARATEPDASAYSIVESASAN
jgi:asparagine synthase (glutamine-hydrolysing)